MHRNKCKKKLKCRDGEIARHTPFKRERIMRVGWTPTLGTNTK